MTAVPIANGKDSPVMLSVTLSEDAVRFLYAAVTTLDTVLTDNGFSPTSKGKAARDEALAALDAAEPVAVSA